VVVWISHVGLQRGGTLPNGSALRRLPRGSMAIDSEIKLLGRAAWTIRSHECSARDIKKGWGDWGSDAPRRNHFVIPSHRRISSENVTAPLTSRTIAVAAVASIIAPV
jgi:hypothetical protein